MYPIAQVFCLDLGLCFSQFGSPRLMRGAGHILRDDEAIHIVMKPHAICGGLRNGCRKLLEVRLGALAPIEGRCHDVHHHLSDGCCRRPLGSSLDGAEQLV